MKENIDLLVKKLIGKVFPEFSNKVTWTLIAFGLGLLALPTPTYILFINLILDFYNKKTNSHISLIDINNITPSSGVAISLIIIGLVYHIVIKALQLYPEILKDNRQKEISAKKIIADIFLYERFIELLPPSSLSIELLKDHDFGNSFHENSIKDFNRLRYGWEQPDQHFHNKEVEDKVTTLYSEINNFNSFLSLNSNYIMGGPNISMLTDRDRAMDMEWEPQTEISVRKANEWGTEIYNLYKDFILTCKANFAI